MSKKTLLFHVVGSHLVGLGHIYRSLTIAELFQSNKYEIRFCCSKSDYEYCLKIIEDKYPIDTYQDKAFFKYLERDVPYCVINDILETSEEFMQKIRSLGIKSINFEDIGAGSRFADLVINELFDEPLNDFSNTAWGHQYYLLRQEFFNATMHTFSNKVKSILITFGGTDQNNLTASVLDNIWKICLEHGVEINIVTGGGYLYIDSLKEKISLLRNQKLKINFVHHSGLISQIMERCQLAITANGRTIYELAYLNIPSLVFSHHERETTHLFAQRSNGFFPMGLYDEKSSKILCELVNKLISENSFRREAFNKIESNSFSGNKIRVINLLNNVLNKE